MVFKQRRDRKRPVVFLKFWFFELPVRNDFFDISLVCYIDLHAIAPVVIFCRASAKTGHRNDCRNQKNRDFFDPFSKMSHIVSFRTTQNRPPMFSVHFNIGGVKSKLKNCALVKVISKNDIVSAYFNPCPEQRIRRSRPFRHL